jgi:nucleoid-associated protein YgaU
VPEIDKLTVGTTIRIPPPEALDRRQIEPNRPSAAGTSPTSGSTAPLRQASSRPGEGKGAKKPGEIEVALPTSDPFARRRGEPGESDRGESAVSRGGQPRRPRYRVHSHETLRSIARDTLGDSHRADEIRELNADVIDDPNHLIPGQILELPDDAKVGNGDGGGARDR